MILICIFLFDYKFHLINFRFSFAELVGHVLGNDNWWWLYFQLDQFYWSKYQVILWFIIISLVPKIPFISLPLISLFMLGVFQCFWQHLLYLHNFCWEESTKERGRSWRSSLKYEQIKPSRCIIMLFPLWVISFNAAAIPGYLCSPIYTNLFIAFSIGWILPISLLWIQFSHLSICFTLS